MKPWEMTYWDIGVVPSQDDTHVSVWAPGAKSVKILYNDLSTDLIQDEFSVWNGNLNRLREGDVYWISIDDKSKLPDPASRYQPDGIFGPSKVMPHRERGEREEGINIDLKEAIMYELHIGTFTPSGTLASAIERLDYLKNFGVTAIELMPISQFEGNRNWGYDGVFPYAVQNTYGTPGDLTNFIHRAHSVGISVLLDVVYNHLGPRGNVFPAFGPYFTSKYRNPWGTCLNFDDNYSDYVRSFFINNAIYWIDQFGIDGLRLDAIHGIIDNSPVHFIKELNQAVKTYFKGTEKKPVLIAESDLNDPKIIRSKESCGFGIDAQWCDDFHHSIHSLLTGEQRGYYSDYGELGMVVKALRNGFVYTGDYSSFLKRKRGSNDSRYNSYQLVVFSQNHDQVGNRPLSDRSSRYLDDDSLKLMVTMVVLSPFVPLVFMGEEFKSDSPFYFFIDTSDKEFASLVRKGREEEFKYFGQSGFIPDPSTEEAFSSSKLNWQQSQTNSEFLAFYEQAIAIRKRYHIGLAKSVAVSTSENIVMLSYLLNDDRNLTCIYNLGESRQIVPEEEHPTFLLENKSVFHESDHKLVLEPRGFVIVENSVSFQIE